MSRSRISGIYERADKFQRTIAPQLKRKKQTIRPCKSKKGKVITVPVAKTGPFLTTSRQSIAWDPEVELGVVNDVPSGLQNVYEMLKVMANAGFALKRAIGDNKYSYCSRRTLAPPVIQR
jgi:hypothetical protein